MKDDEVIEEVLENLAKIFSKPYSFLRRAFHRGYVKRWAKDPFFLGAWTFPSPNQTSQECILTKEIMAMNEGNRRMASSTQSPLIG